MIMHKVLRLLILALALMAGQAYAACSNPAGAAGQTRYASNYNVMVYCDGTNWVSMAGGVSVTVGGTTNNPGGNNTNIQYNSGGSFAGSDNLAWDNTNRNMQVSGSVQFGGTGSEACSSAADYGKNRRNPTSGRMQVCLFR
ncbi:hypothetical protein BDS110ZK25_53480 [Bradyrhizobium diazoefficiens]